MTNGIILCVNGHVNQKGGGAFCIYCGGQLGGMQGQYGPPLQTPQFIPLPPIPRCGGCGGDGSLLPAATVVCPQCRWLRPLAPGYKIDCSVFQWAQDGSAMATLRSIGPLTAAASAVSDKIGRRWVESNFNGVRLSERQLPGVYAQSVRAARLLGMSAMPDVYVSGDRMWEAATYGSDKAAFIVLGTALVTNFVGEDLLFVIAREMGHCRAGHALWKTVIRFLIGEQGPKRGMLAGGILDALSITKLIEGAFELPLLAWARQAEITADRAGLLAVGNEEAVRRVLLSWNLRSLMLYRQINLEAWLEQQGDSEDDVTKLSEMMSSSTPYITRRLQLSMQFARSPELIRWSGLIRPMAPPDPMLPQGIAPPGPPPGTAPAPRPAPAQAAPAAAGPAQPKTEAPAEEMVRLVCPTCQTALRVPVSVLKGKDSLNVKCPAATCGKVFTIRRKAEAADATPARTNGSPDAGAGASAAAAGGASGAEKEAQGAEGAGDL